MFSCPESTLNLPKSVFVPLKVFSIPVVNRVVAIHGVAVNLPSRGLSPLPLGSRQALNNRMDLLGR